MKKIDRIINNLREMMTGNAPGVSTAFTSQSPAEGPVAGYDPLTGGRMNRRNSGLDMRTIPPHRRRWAKAARKNNQ